PAEPGGASGQATQRPPSRVAESVVVAALLLGRQRPPPQLIQRVLRWHADPVVAVHALTVGGAAAVSDPRARAGAHDRLQRRDQATRGPPDGDVFALAHVDVRLPV